MTVGISGPLPGRPAIFVSCRSARRAGVAAQARARNTGCASPSTEVTRPCRAWAGPKRRALGRAAVLRAIWPSMPCGLLFSRARLRWARDAGCSISVRVASDGKSARCAQRRHCPSGPGDRSTKVYAGFPEHTRTTLYVHRKYTAAAGCYKTRYSR
jgi:hypothetical protein